jgi:hypothetical protein
MAVELLPCAGAGEASYEGPCNLGNNRFKDNSILDSDSPLALTRRGVHKALLPAGIAFLPNCHEIGHKISL